MTGSERIATKARLARRRHGRRHEQSLTDAFLVGKAAGVQVAPIEGDVKEQGDRITHFVATLD